MFDYPESTFSFCPSCGGRTISSPRWGRIICSSCGFDFYFNIASAAAAIIKDSKGEILLIRRAHDPAKGLLDLPGGFLDENETAEAGLAREIFEETGLRVSSFTYLCTFPNRYDYKQIRYRTMDLFFVAHVDNLSAARPLDEVSEVVIRQAADVDLNELAFESVRNVFRSFMKTYI